MESLEESSGQTEKTFEEIMATNFPKLMKTIIPQMQKVEGTPSTRNMKKIKLNHIIIKLLKTSKKRKSLKPVREKRQVTHRETKRRQTDSSPKGGWEEGRGGDEAS